ncbi:MAG TPA: MupA/Atu3671 family FMN-dependent luciferase-like monooxygenase [Pyrinomonadaceae bacterium]|nr:MupA/Atu3671 family FMN-dependent luciferase-like monooxygenase [Pyrinomonadaceae bacterium]
MKNVADVYHLTRVQRDVLSDPRSARVVQVRRKVHGELDSEAFEQAWRDLLARHTILRTCFLTQLEEPVQVVRQQVKLAYERHDCGAEPERVQAEVERLLEVDARREFDPVRAPLFRVMEIRLGARLFEIVLSYHPVLLDERSVELMFDEVLSGTRGEATAYRDYVAWVERQDASGVELFYRNRKRDAGATVLQTLNLEVFDNDGLEAFARSMGVSVETVIAGARALALLREQERGEITIEVTADKRPQALHGSDQIIGLLSNLLPLPITAPGEKSLSEWFQDIEHKRTKLECYGHVSRSQIKPWLDDAPLPEPENELDFSLFYFADDNAVYGEDKYRLYREGAVFADRHHLAAVWTPERHFHEKAGLYPNPSVLSAALATITNHVQLRAGSVVLPLHNSLRVAEEWSVVDNLSQGRAGVSFTSGWMPNDFAFFPERYPTKREEMFRGIQEVQELWRGQPIAGRDGVGKEIELRIFPKPIQAELPIWLTCSGGPEMFEKAGELGCHVLTALLTQSLEEATPKIQLYRDSLARHGHDPRSGKVVMMMHTFIGEDAEAVLQKVRAPLTKYLKSHLNLIETGAESLNLGVDVRDQDPEKVRDQMAAFAFERYYRTSSLIGTPTSCMKMIERLKAIGVDEVACLIDFGIDVDSVLESLEHLVVLRDLSNAVRVEKSLLAHV